MKLEKTSVIYDPETKIVFGEFPECTEVHLAKAKMYEGFLNEFINENPDYKIIGDTY